MWAMSALPPKADIERHDWHVRFVPKANIRIAANLFDHLVGEREQIVGDFERRLFVCQWSIDVSLWTTTAFSDDPIGRKLA